MLSCGLLVIYFSGRIHPDKLGLKRCKMIFPLPQGAFKKRSEGLGKAGSMCTIMFDFVLHSQQSMRPGQAMSILLVMLYFRPDCFFNGGCILFNKISELVDIGCGQSDFLGSGS